MQIPPLPTDNLHKFQALTGLWLVVLTLSVPSYAIFAVRGEMIDTERDADILSIEIEHSAAKLAHDLKSIDGLSERSKALEADVQQLAAARISKEQRFAELGQLRDRLGRLRETIEETRKRSDSEQESEKRLRQEMVRVGALLERLNLYVDSIAALSTYSVVGLTAGALLTYRGFHKWGQMQTVVDDELRLRVRGMPQRPTRDAVRAPAQSDLMDAAPADGPTGGEPPALRLNLSVGTAAMQADPASSDKSDGIVRNS